MNSECVRIVHHPKLYETKQDWPAAGRNYDFYFLFHGIVQHSLYHGRQIALLKRGGV